MSERSIGFLLITVLMVMISLTVQGMVLDDDRLFLDDCEKLDAYWKLGGTSKDNLFIVDSEGTNDDIMVPAGQYRLYGEPGPDFVMMNAFFPVSPGDWILEFRAKMVSLGTFLPSIDLDNTSNSAYRGFTVGVRFDGTKTFVIGFNRGVIGVLGSAEVYQRVDESILGGEEEEYHVWRIEYKFNDASMVISKDDVDIARFSHVVGSASTAQGGLRVFCAPINVYGNIDLYIDYMALQASR